ncbi:hypothetical protein T265_00213 [Opisthorchis viverrini]|uniref:Structural maintenance of chromosomes protein n=1 Tax=Opisthorchis viverrini TaxID=6198 RepID=A0A075AD62_OPIVI|nr:hypothetical protein T265_00213 [Opisthorchis viverrini]KER34025.1 hypothetical protein T265_00213 [Opisthorchis viverrini]
MYIKSLIIDGFKSYCQRTEINGFDPQFNAITGLNGSGKSNILDAVCFLLGITNLSQVRAANLQELVYKCGQAGITKATVSAVFDNLDKSQSPYGYEQFDELTITRQVVFRVHDLFHSVQLNVNNPHFLIMQGRITKILNMKPPEILSLLEEAASTKLYEHKKEMALKTIEKKDGKLREIDRVLREDINPTITKLREERSSYLEYQNIVREMTHLEKFIIAYDFYCLEAAKHRSKEDLVALERSLSELKEKVKQFVEGKTSVERRIVELSAQRDEGSALEELESVMSTCQKTEAVAKGAANRASEALRAANQRIKNLESQCTETETQLNAKHEAAEAAAGKEFKAIQAEAEDAKAKLEAAQRRLQAANSGLSSGEDGVAASLAEQARMADGEKCAAQTELRQLEMRQKHLRAELTKQEAAVVKVFGRLSMSASKSKEEIEQQRLTEEIEKLTQRLTRAEADDRALGSEAALAERQFALAKEAREARHQANAASANFPQLAFEFTQPEPNFDRSHVYGPVAKLINVTDLKYATALEVAAGARLYNIVVDSDRTSKLLLERGQLRRRVTILPLNQIRGSSIPPAVVRQAESLVGAQNVATALSLIEYPSHLQPAMEYVFGNILVCPDLNTARRVAFHPGIERRTVTWEGDVFDPQGTLSGGSRAPASESLLSRLFSCNQLESIAQKAEDELKRGDFNLQAARKRSQEIAQLREALDAARHQLGILETELRQTDKHRLKADVIATREELDPRLFGHQIYVCWSELESVNLVRFIIPSRLLDGISDLQIGNSQLGVAQSLPSSYTPYGSIRMLFRTVRTLYLHHIVLKHILNSHLTVYLFLMSRYLERVASALEQAKDRLAKACTKAEQAHTKAVNAAAEREKEKHEAEAALTEAKTRVEATANALRDKTAVKETLRLEAEELTKELNVLKLTLQEAEASLKAAEDEVAKCTEELKKATRELQEARAAVTKQRNLIDETVRALAAAEKRVNQLVQNINQTNVQIEKLMHQLELQTKESEEAGCKIERLLTAHPWITEERQHFGVENGAYCFTTRDPNEARRRIQTLKERRERLSRTVNMRAMNMLGSAEEQYAELIRRQEIVLADKRKIQAVIDDLDKRKKEVLMSAYNKVNEEFCNIFGTLLPGSKARLLPPENMTVLDGLEIKVAFGDVWKDSLSELSGGQRSLAALSLILALLLFKPAPLYILDEVDAALDLSHTQNIGQLIKNHFQHSQFLIVSLKDGMFNNANVLFKTKFQDGVSTVTRHVPFRGAKNANDENVPSNIEKQRRRVR